MEREKYRREWIKKTTYPAPVLKYGMRENGGVTNQLEE